MNVHRTSVILERDGTLMLKDLPFQAGDSVEVTIQEKPDTEARIAWLQGKVLRYDLPTEPVAEQDWEDME